MVTAFLQLHHDVYQGAVTISLGTESLVVTCQDQLVILPEGGGVII